MCCFCFGHRRGSSRLLIHPVKMMQRACPVTKRKGVGDGGGDVGLRKKNGLWQSATMGKMAGEGR